MGMRQFVANELVEIIEWVDDSRDTLAHRFPDNDRAIKNGAQLIVRESQHAQLVHAGEFADAFAPGRHRLITENIPVLTRLASWRCGFESPFKVDVYFVTTRLCTGNKWGTTHPVLMRDNDFGVVRARAFGTYDFRVTNPRLFLKDVVGTDRDFTVRDFDDTMRSRVVSAFSDALASATIRCSTWRRATPSSARRCCPPSIRSSPRSTASRSPPSSSRTSRCRRRSKRQSMRVRGWRASAI